MLKIKEFAQLTRVSVRMLRHYDDLGLLKPVHVDPMTHYRYYSADQLPMLQRIIAMKDLGFGLEQIAQITHQVMPSDELRGMLRLREAQLEELLTQEQMRLAQVRARLLHLERYGTLPQHEVVVREVPSVIIAGIRKVITDFGEIEELFQKAHAHAAAYEAISDEPQFVIHHDHGINSTRHEIEVAMPLTHPIPSAEGVVIRELPSVPEMACVIFAGGFDQMSSAYETLTTWLEANQYQVTGSLRHFDSLLTRNNSETDNLSISELRLPIDSSFPITMRRSAMKPESSKTGINGIRQIAIRVHDLKKATAFYRDVLGIKYLFEIPQAVFFDCGGIRLMLSLPEQKEFDHPASIIYYNVDDIQATHDLLSSRGVRFGSKPHLIARLDTIDIWLAEFRDQDNNYLALMSEVPKSK